MVLWKAWKWYQKCLAVHPVKTQTVSSGILWGMGDLAAQTVTHYSVPKNKQHQNHDRGQELKINWKRVASISMFGFAVVGPFGHLWYEGLDKFITRQLRFQPKSVRFVTAKVAIEGLIFAPMDLCLFLSYVGLSSGKSWAQVKQDVKRDFIPAFLVQGGVWPLVQVVNFRFVPVRYQLLYVNIFCLFDTSFLSWLDQQEDAPWKQWFKSFLALKEKESHG